MVNQVESESSLQPRPSEKGKKLGGLRGKFATATIFVGGLTAAAAGLPSPVDAGGDRMLMTAGANPTGEFCDNSNNIFVTDLVYAAQLLEQLASGEIVIAFGPAPVAAANEGDQTAVTKPITITPDEIWANLAKPAPECPVVVEPTPTPTLSPEEIAKLTEKNSLKEFLKLKDKPITQNQFLQILQDTTLKTTEYYKKHGIGIYTTEELIKEDTNYYNTFHKSWSMEYAGTRIVTKVVYNLSFAQQAAQEGDAETAAAMANRAEAYVRLGKTFINFKKSPSELDTEIQRKAKELNIQ